MKEAVYKAIIEKFAEWASTYSRVCRRGCSACCTQNVTITALEGGNILAYIRENGKEAWLAEKLCQNPPSSRPRMTTNEFAHICLSGREADPGESESLSPCPFLEEDVCMIYPARPFSCRCFISGVRCSASQPAQVEEGYLAAATVMMQLIEHLGQKEYWGNMQDVLLALCDISINRPIAEQLDDSTHIMQARLRTHSARPLPGFLLSEEDERIVEPLLADVFAVRVDGKSIEDILNGK